MRSECGRHTLIVRDDDGLSVQSETIAPAGARKTRRLSHLIPSRTRVSPRVERRKELVTTERYWMNSPLPEVLGREMEPFQEQFVVVLDPGVANGGAFQQVPAGKRAVIEHASVHADPADAAVKANYFVTSTIGGTSNFRDVPILVVRWGIAVVGSHPVRAYADPGSEYGGTIRRLETTQRLAATFVFAGYYVPS